MKARVWPVYISYPALLGGVFPPEDKAQLEEALRQAPPALDAAVPAPTRWSLAYMRRALAVLQDYSPGGLWQLLRRLEITYRRGRQALHSPDPDYVPKRDYARQCVQEAREQPGVRVTLYLDELSFYRQPSVAPCWWHRDWQGGQPRGRLSHRSNTVGRVVGALDVVSGQVLAAQGSKIGVKKLCHFYQQIRAAYPHAQSIRVIQDNWPVHFHPEVQAAAQAAGIELVRLPTYAPWLNPIEKLWRKLKQEVLHMHRFSDAWDELKQRVKSYLDQFASGSPDLLHYVGLLPDGLPN